MCSPRLLTWIRNRPGLAFGDDTELLQRRRDSWYSHSLAVAVPAIPASAAGAAPRHLQKQVRVGFKSG